MTVPPEARVAAHEAFAAVYNDPATMTACIDAAVAAAAPLIAAAERERIAAYLRPDADGPLSDRVVAAVAQAMAHGGSPDCSCEEWHEEAVGGMRDDAVNAIEAVADLLREVPS